MNRIIGCLLILSLPAFAHAQEIVNYAMVGDHGITKDPNKATFLIVIKSFGDTVFQRLEYKFTGPLVRVFTYRNPDMQVKEGAFREFDSNGKLAVQRQYHLIQKEGEWYDMDDSLHPVTQTRVHLATVLFTWDKDSIRIHNEMDEAARKAAHPEDIWNDYKDISASFPGGDKGWLRYIQSKYDDHYPERARSLGATGKVLVQFILDTTGSVSNAEILRSVELSVDEAVLSWLYASPKWRPAFQRNHHVKAYRREVFTFNLPD